MDQAERERLQAEAQHAQEFSEAYDRFQRTARTAATYVDKTAGMAAGLVNGTWGVPQALDANFIGIDERGFVDYEIGRLLRKVLSDVEWMVGLLRDEDGVGEVVERINRVLKNLDRRRLASKLEQVDGRTPEEAAAYLRKAAELRRANGLQEQP